MLPTSYFIDSISAETSTFTALSTQQFSYLFFVCVENANCAYLFVLFLFGMVYMAIGDVITFSNMKSIFFLLANFFARYYSVSFGTLQLF